MNISTTVSDKITGGVMPTNLIKPFYENRKLAIPIKAKNNDLLSLFPDCILEAQGKLGVDAMEEDIMKLAVTLAESNVKKLVWHSAAIGITTVRMEGKCRSCVVIKIPYEKPLDFSEPLYSFNPNHFMTKYNMATEASLDEAIDKTIEQITKLETLVGMGYIKLSDIKPSNVFDFINAGYETKLSYTYERNVKSNTGHKSKVIMQSAPQYVDNNLFKQARSKPLNIKDLLAVLSDNGNVWGDLSNGRSLGKIEKALELQYDNDYYSVKNGFLVGCYYDMETGQLRNNSLPMSSDNIAGQAGKTPGIYHINMPTCVQYNFFLTKLGIKGYVVDPEKEIKAFIKSTTNTIIKAGTHAFCEKVATQIGINLAILKSQGLTANRLEKQGVAISPPITGLKIKENNMVPIFLMDRIPDKAQFVILTDNKGLNAVEEMKKKMDR